MALAENKKILTVSFVVAGVLAGIVVKAIFEVLASSFSSVARLYDMDAFRHGLPLLTGIITAGVLQFTPKILALADEVVTEFKKIVWPSQKDTTSMTIVCLIMITVFAVILGLLDFFSNYFVKLLI